MTSRFKLATRLRSALAVAATCGLLAACGGGTSQIDPYIAKRVLAFGDETSVLTTAGPQPEFDPAGPLGPDGPAGRKYSVNARNGLGNADCSAEPNWVQAVAGLYALVFEECNPHAATVFNAKMYARVGARVADFVTQIDSFVASGGAQDRDMATVLVGANDVLALYRQFPVRAEADLIAEAESLGDAMGVQVNRLIGLGPRVLLSTVPDMGLSPYALAEKAANTDIDRAALLSRLTRAFNLRMRVGILNDGRYLGLVLGDEMVQTLVKFPSNYGLRNATTAACTVALPDCNPDTLVPDASSVAWLWADGTRLAFGGQTRLSSLAVARATGNPF